MEFRLTLDEPYRFAVKPGFRKRVHANEFLKQKRPDYDSVWLENSASLLMLGYSFHRPEWSVNTVPLSQLRKDAAHWKAVKRQSGHFLTSVNPSPGMGISSPVTLVNFASGNWVWETNFLLAHDESFAFYFHVLTDETRRSGDAFFLLQWDNIGILIFDDGSLVALQYDRADKSDASKVKTLVRRQIATPTQIYQHLNYLVFIPSPVGLIVEYGIGTENLADLGMGAGGSVNISNSVVIPFEPRWIGGQWRLTEMSSVLCAIDPSVSVMCGLERVRFASSGFYTDKPFDLGYKPASSPDLLTPEGFYKASTGASASLQNGENSGAWAAGTDRQARVKLSLSTSDTKYTPFVYGYEVNWSPVFETRDTTAILIANKDIASLEYSVDEWGRDEGTAQIYARTNEVKRLIERGDTTYKLQARDAGEDDWETLGGGIAKVGSFELRINAAEQWWYAADLNLSGLWALMSEKHILDETSYDGKDAGTSANLILEGSGLEPIPVGNIPSTVTNTRVAAAPPDGKTTYHYAIKRGMTGWEAMRVCMMHLMRQNEEWRLLYDWTNLQWKWEQKPRSASLASPWELRNKNARRDATGRVWFYSEAKFQPLSPEANWIQVTGVGTPQWMMGNPVQLQQTLINVKSLTDKTSRDFLSRILSVIFQCEELHEQADVDQWALRLYAAVAHWRLKGAIVSNLPTLKLKPDAYLRFYSPQNEALFDLWVKKRTFKKQGSKQTMTLHTDTVWEIDLKEVL